MKTTAEAMSGIFTQLTGQNKGVMPLVEACNLILEYVLENGFGGGSSNPLTPAQIEKIKEDVINKIKTQVPIGIMLKDCELIDSKLKFTLSNNSNKELDLANLINKSVKDYVDTHKSELKGDRGLKGEQGQRGIDGVGITNISKIGDKLKITLSDGQEKEFDLPKASGGTGGLTEQEVKTLIDTLYKPSIDSKQDKSSALKLADVKAEIQKVVGTAPEALNTLQEIAEALGNDPNKINTILTQLGLKADKVDLNSLKEKVITEINFENNKIKYKENGLSKEIDLSSYINQSTQDIETIVENKGNTLFESKDNTIVKNLQYDNSSKKITYKINNENKEINLPNLQGKDGTSLDFNWEGTKLGIKKSTETSYTYVDLKGSEGIQGLKGKGIKEISLVGNNLNIKLDTDEIITIALPLLKGEQGDKGKDGTGITNIQKINDSSFKIIYGANNNSIDITMPFTTENEIKGVVNKITTNVYWENNPDKLVNQEGIFNLSTNLQGNLCSMLGNGQQHLTEWDGNGLKEVETPRYYKYQNKLLYLKNKRKTGSQYWYEKEERGIHQIFEKLFKFEKVFEGGIIFQPGKANKICDLPTDWKMVFLFNGHYWNNMDQGDIQPGIIMIYNTGKTVFTKTKSWGPNTIQIENNIISILTYFDFPEFEVYVMKGV